MGQFRRTSHTGWQLPSRSRGLRFAQGPTRLRSLLRARCAPGVLRCGSAIVSLEAPRLSLGFRVWVSGCLLAQWLVIHARMAPSHTRRIFFACVKVLLNPPVVMMPRAPVMDGNAPGGRLGI